MSHKIRHRLAVKIRLLRKQQGWSQEKLAEACGLHRTYIGAVERCERNISLDNLTRIAIALDTDIAALFTDPDGHPPLRHQIRETSAIYRQSMPFIYSRILHQWCCTG